MSLSLETIYSTHYAAGLSNGAVAVETMVEPIATVTYMPDATIKAAGGYITPAPVTGTDGYVTEYLIQPSSTVWIRKAQATGQAKGAGSKISPKWFIMVGALLLSTIIP